MNLDNKVIVRSGYPAIDLLNGGAVGFGTAPTRHALDMSANLSDREVGLRLTGTWRSASTLDAGPDLSGRLRLSAYAIVSARAFADLGQVFPANSLLKGTRVSLNAVNLFNTRQRIVDDSQATPLRYQRGYRDPLGRTLELELRKSF